MPTIDIQVFSSGNPIVHGSAEINAVPRPTGLAPADRTSNLPAITDIETKYATRWDDYTYYSA